jgi:hypothetical protein
MKEYLTIAAIVLVIIVSALIVRWIIQSRRILRVVQDHPDDAYEFFRSHPDSWLLLPGPAGALQPDHVPAGPGGPGSKPLGPIEFRVPKLSGRTVSVFGISRQSMADLKAFEKQTTKRGPHGS